MPSSSWKIIGHYFFTLFFIALTLLSSIAISNITGSPTVTVFYFFIVLTFDLILVASMLLNDLRCSKRLITVSHYSQLDPSGFIKCVLIWFTAAALIQSCIVLFVDHLSTTEANTPTLDAIVRIIDPVTNFLTGVYISISELEIYFERIDRLERKSTVVTSMILSHLVELLSLIALVVTILLPYKETRIPKIKKSIKPINRFFVFAILFLVIVLLLSMRVQIGFSVISREEYLKFYEGIEDSPTILILNMIKHSIVSYWVVVLCILFVRNIFDTVSHIRSISTVKINRG